MKQGDVLILHGGRVWTDAEGVDDAFGLDDLEYKLLFGFGYGFPGAAEGERLFGSAHFAGDDGVDGGRLKVVVGWADGRPVVASGDNQQGDPLADTFGDRDGARKQGLLIVA